LDYYKIRIGIISVFSNIFSLQNSHPKFKPDCFKTQTYVGFLINHHRKLPLRFGAWRSGREMENFPVKPHKSRNKSTKFRVTTKPALAAKPAVITRFLLLYNHLNFLIMSKNLFL
jgi:hypothetical protein